MTRCCASLPMNKCVTRCEQDWDRNPPIGGDSIVNSPMPTEVNAASNAIVDLASRSWIRNLRRASPSP
jgi:hypothetical protein